MATTAPVVSSAPFDPAFGAPGAALAVCVMVEAVVLLILGLRGKLYVPMRKNVGFILLGLFIFGALRFVWYMLRMTIGRGRPDFIINRLAWIVYVNTFLLLLFSWMETVHSRVPPPSDRLLPIVKWAFIITAAILTVFMVALLIAWAATGGTLEGNPAYEANIISMVVCMALLSILFLAYGCVLLYRLMTSMRGSDTSVMVVDSKSLAKQKSTLYKLIIVMTVITTCFLIRSGMFLYRPITNSTINIVVFYVFAYMIPETLPAIVQMFVIVSTSQSRKKAALEAKNLQSSRSGSRSNASASPLLHNVYADPEENIDDRDVSSEIAREMGYNYSDMGSEIEPDDAELMSATEGVLDYSKLGVSGIHGQ